MPIRFYLHTKTYSDGRRPIYLDARWGRRAASDGQAEARLRTSTGQSCQPANWNPDKQRIKSAEPDYAKSNRELVRLEAAAGQHIERAELDAVVLPPEQLTALLKPAAAARKEAAKAAAVPVQGPSAAGAVPGPVTMASLYAQWQHAYRGRRAAKTLSGPQGLIDQLERFRPGLTPLDFVPDASGRCEVLQDFCVYCMEQAKGRTGDVGLFNNTISSYLKRLRKLLKFGRYDYEWIEDEYSEEVDREPLTFSEVLQLAQHNVVEWREGGNKHSLRAGIRDVFVFICLTGPRYGSLLEVGPDAVVFDHLAGAEIPVLEYYTYKNRRNKEKVRVPLDELAYTIWQRYDGKLPVPSLGKFNEAIKQLCREAGLTRTVKVLRGSGAKRLEERQPLWQTVSAHIGRYTFITTQHEGGADLVSIQDTVGHADINTTRKYTKSREKDRLTTTRGAFTTLRNRQS
jgi:site-specific recombinase XerD